MFRKKNLIFTHLSISSAQAQLRSVQLTAQLSSKAAQLSSSSSELEYRSAQLTAQLKLRVTELMSITINNKSFKYEIQIK
jgi:hypothetical protein